MLSNTERNNIEICTKKIKDYLSIPALADFFNLSTRTIDRALKWGKQNNFFLRDATDKLEQHILEFKSHLNRAIELSRSAGDRINRATTELGEASEIITGLESELEQERLGYQELERINQQLENANREQRELYQGIKSENRDSRKLVDEIAGRNQEIRALITKTIAVIDGYKVGNPCGCTCRIFNRC